MSARTNLVLFVIAILLTVYITVWEQNRVPEWDRAGRVFPEVDSPDIVELSVSHLGADGPEKLGAASGTLRVARRGEFDWEIVEPIHFPALIPRVQGMTWNIVDLVQIERLPPERAGVFEPTDLRFSFRTRQGVEHVVEVGQDFPDSVTDYCYIRVDGKDVHVTKREVRPNFSVTLDDVRSRALFPIAAPDAIRLSVERRDRPGFAIARTTVDDEWGFLDDPELAGAAADRRRIKEMIDELNAWRIDEFQTAETPTPELRATWGLDPPLCHIEALHQSGTRVDLDVGEPFERSGVRRVRVAPRGTSWVFTAEAEPLDVLVGGADELRTQFVLDLQGLRIDRVSCRGPNGAFTIDRIAITEEERGAGEVSVASDWRWELRAEGSTTVDPGDPTVITGAIAELQDLAIQKFLPMVGDAERATFDRTITVKLETGDEHSFSIGPRSTHPRDEGLEVYEAIRSADRSHFLVESYWPERVDRGLYFFRDRAISDVAPGQIFRIEVHDGDERFELIRVPGQPWQLPGTVSLVPGAALDDGAVQAVVDALGRDRLRVRRFVPELPRERWDDWGIGQVVYRQLIALTFVDGKNDGFERLRIGELESNDESPLYWCRADRPAVPFLIDGSLPSKIERLATHLRDVTGRAR